MSSHHGFMQHKKRNALGAVAMILACAACCALPIFLTGGVAGVIGGIAAEFAQLSGWMAGVGIAAVVILLGCWLFVRRRQPRGSRE